MDIKELLEALAPFTVNETVERYLSVEPADEGKAIEVFLYQGDKKSENSFMLDKNYIGKDDAVREQAKAEFDNITDDIRVAWF